MTITTHSQYKARLNDWAARTRSEPLDSWHGPGEYKPTGFYSDEWRPTATIQIIGRRRTTTTTTTTTTTRQGA